MERIPRTLYGDEHAQFRSSFRSWLDHEVVPHHVVHAQATEIMKEIVGRALVG